MITKCLLKLKIYVLEQILQEIINLVTLMFCIHIFVLATLKLLFIIIGSMIF